MGMADSLDPSLSLERTSLALSWFMVVASLSKTFIAGSYRPEGVLTYDIGTLTSERNFIQHYGTLTVT